MGGNRHECCMVECSSTCGLLRYVTNGPRFTGGIEGAALTLRAPLLEMGLFLRNYKVHPHDYIDERLVSSTDIHLSSSQSIYVEAPGHSANSLD